jgi:hypothetical protein
MGENSKKIKKKLKFTLFVIRVMMRQGVEIYKKYTL